MLAAARSIPGQGARFSSQTLCDIELRDGGPAFLRAVPCSGGGGRGERGGGFSPLILCATDFRTGLVVGCFLWVLSLNKASERLYPCSCLSTFLPVRAIFYNSPEIIVLVSWT